MTHYPWQRWPLTVVDHSEDDNGMAVFDGSRQHRLLLGRRWGDESTPSMTFVMLNPSTADAFIIDRTIGRCIEFAKREDAGRLWVVNLFSLRTPHPRVMKAHATPGDDARNDDFIRWAVEQSPGRVIAGWGQDGKHRGRAVDVLRMLEGTPLFALKIAKNGQPWHPLYVKGDKDASPLLPFRLT